MNILKSVDFHVHTSRSVCCQQSQTLAALVASYASRGFRHVAICDHYYTGRLDLFREARAEVDMLSEQYGLDLRLSAEIEIADASGSLDCPEFEELRILLDHVSAAPHTKRLMKAVPSGADPVRYIHEAHMAALANPEIDVILHPWDGAEVVVSGLDQVPRALLREFAEAAASSGKIVEVSNCMNHYWIRPERFTSGYDALVAELLRADVPLVVGSDGHNMTIVPEASHLSESVTTGDTSWAVSTIERLGGTDQVVRFPDSLRPRQPSTHEVGPDLQDRE